MSSARENTATDSGPERSSGYPIQYPDTVLILQTAADYRFAAVLYCIIVVGDELYDIIWNYIKLYDIIVLM